MNLETRWCSSLAKVLPAREPDCEPFRSGTALRGENFSLQLAYRAVDFHFTKIGIEIKSDLKEFISVRRVDLVPAEFVSYEFDDDYISREPGLYPDILSEIRDGAVDAVLGQWRSLWFRIAVPQDCGPGVYSVAVTLSADTGKESVRKTVSFDLEVIDAALPEQTLVNTHWFHSDCLAAYYGVDVFSEKYWSIVGRFMKNAAEHGINMILTPVFTPPLDTRPGGERPTVQLVDVRLNGGEYSFGFEKLDRWIALASSCGMKYFEISHLFTQWGAKFTPKIIAGTDGAEKRIFGWDVRSDSPEYMKFLDAFLPELVRHLKEKRLQSNVYFHCSDEPCANDVESYGKAVAALRRHLAGFKIIDALSDVTFFKKGLVSIPIPNEFSLDDFIAAGTAERWTYYCCHPTVTFSNRFICMPSSRNRIMGTLLYYYGVHGFLHWGYNFYFSALSRHLIDPYRCTDDELVHPAGDPFVVYPGEDGVPVDSVRHEVFAEGLQDQRALQLLETAMPQESVLKELDKFSPNSKMSMADYPRGERKVLAMRGRINRLIKERCAPHAG